MVGRSGKAGSRFGPVVARPISRPSFTKSCTGAMLENIIFTSPDSRSFTVSPPPR